MRTEYRYIVTRDTARVERYDTVRMEIRGDTVRIFEKLHEIEYYSTIYRDTLRQSDTLRVETVREIEKPAKRGRWWRWMLAGAALGAALATAIRILVKIYFKR